MVEAWSMTEQQRLFLVQARTDFAVFKLLESQRDLPGCHALHYLQMATEMLGKTRLGTGSSSSHIALVPFLKSMQTNREAQRQLGYSGRNENWQHTIRKSIQLAEQIQVLAPKLAGDGPNPEYPWPRENPHVAPAEYRFPIWIELQSNTRFLNLMQRLLESAEAFL